MNLWFPSNLVECLGWMLVHFLWQGCVIAILLAAVLRLLPHAAPDRRYLAGCLGLLLLVAAPLVTFYQVAARHPANPSANLESIPAPLSVESTSRDITPPTNLATAVQVAKGNPGFLQRLETFLPSLVLAWSVGVLALSCRLLGGWLQVRRLKRTATTALDDPWPLKLATLARRLGLRRPVRLWQSALVEVPTVLGWLRPVILLPASCLAGLTPAQLEAILAHELAHIRRHDYLVNLLQSVVETVLFYHPAVWWISRRVREEREHCCDDLAVEICGDRVGYARALATLEELRLAPAPFALAATGAPLLPRIRRLAGKSARSPGRPAWPLAGLIVLFLFAALALGLHSHRAQARNRANDPVNPPLDYQGAARGDLSSTLKSGPVNQHNVSHLMANEVVIVGTNQLYTRTFHLGDVPFRQAMTMDKLRQFQMALFMDADMKNPANDGKATFWSEGKGLLMVRGTIQELDRVETILAQLNIPIQPEENKPAKILVAAKSPANLTSLNYDRLPPASAGKPELVTRSFHLDAFSFRRALRDFKDASPDNLNDPAGDDGGVKPSPIAALGVAVTTNSPAESTPLRHFLLAAGMDLDKNNPANLGKAVFWSGLKGLLMLRATPQELDGVEAALSKLNLPPPAESTKPHPVPQINVQIKFVELNAEPDGSSFIGNLDNSFPAQPATGQPPDSSLVPKLASSPKVFSDPKRPVTNSIIRQMTGVLTGEQASQMLAALERRDGVDILTAPQVTTESGRQARTQIGEMQTVVTGLSSAPETHGTNYMYTSEAIPLGPVLDAIPRVSPDGKIELAVVATLTEFLGYDKPNRAQAAAFPGATVPLPRFRLRKMNTSASVQDGGTLVLGGVEDERVVEVQDKVPLLGDLPLAGRLFRKTIKNKSRKNLLIFITPRLIHPDGTLVHTDPLPPSATN